MQQNLPATFGIRTPSLYLRCWRSSDAVALMEVIAANLDHLRPWMIWAHNEPESLEAKRKLLRRFRSNFIRRTALNFGIFDGQARDICGAIGLHMRIGAGAGEIGYWVRSDRTGRGIASEAAAALTQLGFRHLNLRRMEIQCDPRNLPSAAVPRKLGYELQTMVRARLIDAKSKPRDSAIWSMLAGQFDESPAAKLPIQAPVD